MINRSHGRATGRPLAIPLGLAAGLSLIAGSAFAQTPVTNYEYDTNGNRTKIIAPLGRVTAMSYDALNRRKRLWGQSHDY